MTTRMERRVSQRQKKRYQIFFRSRERSSSGESVNISERGMEIASKVELAEGDILELRIVPSDEIFSFTCDSKVVWVKKSMDNGSNLRYKVGVEFMEGLKDFASNMLIGSDERINQRQSIIIHGDQLSCYRAIGNFESYPSWQKTIKDVKVYERTGDGRPEVVEFVMDAILKNVRYVNKYEYFDRDFILSWKAVEGDIRVNEGSYVFQALRGEKSNAVFSLFVELGFYAPKRIVDYLSNITMRKSMQALKNVVEKGLIK